MSMSPQSRMTSSIYEAEYKQAERLPTRLCSGHSLKYTLELLLIQSLNPQDAFLRGT